MEASQRVGSGTLFLGLIALAAIAIALSITVIPLSRCEPCEILQLLHKAMMSPPSQDHQNIPGGTPYRGCPACTCTECGKRGKVTLLQKWRMPDRTLR